LDRFARTKVPPSAVRSTPAAIGGNLVGMVNFEDYKRRMPAGAQAIFVASKGPYNFLGKKFFSHPP
jgi:transcriptional regulator of nitric oxide reductase